MTDKRDSGTPRTDAAWENWSCAEDDWRLELSIELERELIEARRDAERYRWLRQNGHEHWDEGLPYVVYTIVGDDGDIMNPMIEGAELDAAIDAAAHPAAMEEK